MNIELEQIRAYRLRIHHLDKKLPADGILEAAGVCGLQNSPPGAWETALYNRLEGGSLSMLRRALYEEKSLLQAWSFRGAPVVFPTGLSDVFLTALMAKEGELPWIYTLGLVDALTYLQMPFDDLLKRTKAAAGYLDSHTVKSKELLDKTLAEIIWQGLPEEKRVLWCAPSMYGSPDKQTVGGTVVSFLLRPCSFASFVVFGERQGIHPTFTSFQNWTGHMPEKLPEPDKTLTRKFLHAYGPATLDSFAGWLGCSRQQARRLWESIAEEMEPVTVGRKTCYLLAADVEALLHAGAETDRLMLLGAHDPYLDVRDRAVLLEDPSRQKMVWKTVANPGAILKGGRVAGTWKVKTQREKLDISMALFEPLNAAEQKTLKALAEEYAAFRLLGVRSCQIENEG